MNQTFASLAALIAQEKGDHLFIGIASAAITIIAALFLFSIFLLRSRKKIKEAKLELEHFNQLQETFINANNDLVYLKDEHLNYVFVNKAFEQTYQIKKEEIIGKSDFALSDHKFAAERQRTDLEVLQKQAVVTNDVERNGRIYSCTKFPVPMPGGATGVGAYIRNVTNEREKEKTLQKAAYRNKILIDILSLSFPNKQEQLDYVLHQALELTESQYGYIYYYDEETREFTLNSWTHGVMKECHVLDPQTKYQLEKTGIWGEVVRQRKPIVVNEFAAPNPLKKGYPEGHVQLTKYMSVPVIIDEKIVVVVGLANKLSDYDENDVANITILMNGTWQAIMRKEVEDQLRYERNKYLKTLISIGDGVVVVDGKGNIEMLNLVAQRLTGWTNLEADGKRYQEVFCLSHEMPDQLIEDPIEHVFQTGHVQQLGNHAILTSKSGTQYHIEDSAAPVFNEQGELIGVVLVFRDVTEKMDQHRKIEYLSFHDPLTGLFNRRFCEEKLAQAQADAQLPVCIIMGDINGLKLTNDVFGHNYGDQLLVNIADVLRSSCRANDIIARWGGDEFVLLLPKTGEEEAKKIADRIKSEFSRKLVKGLKGSISMGVACKTTDEEPITDVLERAEENMYSEKTLERKTVTEEWVHTLIQTLHQNSEHEKEHSKNVSLLCEQIGKELGISEAERKKVKLAGYLHDIGKVALESDMLAQSHLLSDEQKVEVRKHPVVGFRLLNTSDNMLEIADAVLAHHEHWDGSGYPKGLKGEEIPLFGRIIAVAERFDKISSSPCGQPAAQMAAAIADLKSNAGTRFDPAIVAGFLQTLEQKT